MDLPGRTEVVDWLGEHPAVRAEEVVTRLRTPGSPQLHESVVLLLADLEASLLVADTGLLADQLAWHRGRLEMVAPEVRLETLVAAVLDQAATHFDGSTLDELRDHLGEASAQVDAARRAVPAVPKRKDLRRLAESYLQHTLAGRADEAIALVVDAAEAGEDPVLLLTEVLEPAQLELGRLWETGDVSVAQERLTTSATERAMTLLHSRLVTPDTRRDERRLVATGVGLGAHEIGLRMVADLLENAGWSVTYLGSGTPAADVVDELVRHDAQLLAVSASMPDQIRVVRTLVAAVRSDPRCSHVRVLVGGRLFRLAPSLTAEVGADDYASDAREAVEVADRLVPTTRVRQ